MTETPDETPTEQLLDGRYRLGECVGTGGMGRVYRAEDIALGRTVAIKMVHPDVEDASAIDRARGEVAVLASLSHPSLVTLFDAQLTPGRPDYLVMEFVEGPTLSARLEHGPLSPVDATQLAAELAEALHVVHAAGIVHRDVKPSNVLLAQTNVPGRAFRAKLADFGIAYLLDGARLTTPGMVVGTAAYLSPEQARGADPTPASDVYSLGLVLLEALTGQRAFPRSTPVEALAARQSTPPVIPDSVPAPWAGLLTRMTALDPAERPTAIEVARSAAALAREPGLAPPVAAALAAPPLIAAGDTGTAATVPLATGADAATMRMPSGDDAATAVLPPADAVPAAANSAGRFTEAPSRRRVRPAALLIGGAAVAAGLAAAGIWAAGGADAPTPERSAVVERTVVTPSETPTEVPVAPVEPLTEEEQKKAEEEQKKAEEARKKADEEAAKKAEEAQKKAEEAQKKAEEEAKKDAEEDGDD